MINLKLDAENKIYKCDLDEATDDDYKKKRKQQRRNGVTELF